jgi:hypothetical protein
VTTAIDITTANRVPLPGGAWADLRPVQDITERRRRPIRTVTMQLLKDRSFVGQIQGALASGKTAQNLTQEDKARIATDLRPESLQTLEDMQDLLIVAVVRGWSFHDEDGRPVPVTIDGILDLPGIALDELKRVTAPYQQALNPNLGEPTPDPASPTAPSSV